MRRWLFAAALLAGCGIAHAAAGATPRVVTLAPHLAELVCAAAGCEALVGISAFTDSPPEARQKPVVGDALSVNAEALLALRPDLVLSWEGGTASAILDRVKQLGVQVRPVRIERLDDVARELEQLGAVLGSHERAHAAALRYRQRLSALAEQQRGKRRLKVLFQIEGQPAYTVNARSPVSEVIRLCGGSNVFADLPALAAPVSDEALLARAPDVVLYGRRDQAAVAATWSRLNPARRPVLIAVDGDRLSRASPGLADAADEVCAGFDRARGRRP